MNKTEALKRLDALETEAAALRSIIEAPEKVEKKPLVQAKEKVGYAVLHGNDGYGAGVSLRFRNSFETLEQAEAYADAFNTLLDLRRQPGSEAAESLTKQWYINSNGVVAYTANLEWKLQQLCPMFDSEASALAASDAVGLDRILRMYNTLHGMGYE